MQNKKRLIEKAKKVEDTSNTLVLLTLLCLHTSWDYTQLLTDGNVITGLVVGTRMYPMSWIMNLREMN